MGTIIGVLIATIAVVFTGVNIVLNLRDDASERLSKFRGR
jgi:hypothetical protein